MVYEDGNIFIFKTNKMGVNMVGGDGGGGRCCGLVNQRINNNL